MKTNWRYKWDNEELKSEFIFLTFISLFPFVAGWYLLVVGKLTGGIVMLIVFLWLQIDTSNLSLLDRVNKLLKRGRR